MSNKEIKPLNRTTMTEMYYVSGYFRSYEHFQRVMQCSDEELAILILKCGPLVARNEPGC